MELKDYMNIAQDLIERDKDRNKMYADMDRMERLEFDLPDSLASLDWMRLMRSTAPYDAIKAGTRTLSGLDERIKINPISVLKGLPRNIDPMGEMAREKANEWETALKWQMDLAARRHGNLREMVIRHALMYDEIVGQIVHLPTQINLIERQGGNARRQKAARAFGDFVVLLRNPQSVHVRYSDYMPEAVLFAAVMKPQEIVDFWGSKAKALKTRLDQDKAGDKWILYDYMDFDHRAVWCVEGNTVDDTISAREGEENVITLFDEEMKLDFLPWAVAKGQGQPLLYGVYKAEQWVNSNIAASLALSEAIAKSGRPEFGVEGPTPEAVEVDYEDVTKQMSIPPGHRVQQFQDPPLDPALRETFDRLQQDMQVSTLPRVLITAEALPDEPFAGYNLRVQQAIASLLPYKNLGERWFANAYRHMIHWIKESGTMIEGYGKDGKYEIKPGEINTERLYLEVELEPDVPLDKQQRMNTAIMASRELPMPWIDLLQMLGDTNPEETIEKYMRQQMSMAALQGILQRIQMEHSGEIERLAAQMAEQQLQTMMEQMPEPMAPQGTPFQGNGFNPAEGGIPAQSFAPGATFEGQTGLTRGGGEVLQ